MSSEQENGIVFPRGADGRRSTAAVGRAVVADALRHVDPVGSRNAEQDTNWRTGYLIHFRRLLEAGLTSREAALTIASDGLGSLHDRMLVATDGGEEVPLRSWTTSPATSSLDTIEVHGEGQPETELSLPYHGRRLRGDDLHERLDAWVAAGVMEPTAAEAVREVMATPDWLRLEGHTVAVIEDRLKEEEDGVF